MMMMYKSVSYVTAVLALIAVAVAALAFAYMLVSSNVSHVTSSTSVLEDVSHELVRLLAIRLVDVGGVRVGFIDVYSSLEGVRIDIIYILEPDGGLAAVARPLGEVYELKRGFQRIPVVIVAGRLREGLDYSIKLGIETSGATRLIPVYGLVAPSLRAAKRYHVYLVRLENTLCSQYVADPTLLEKYLSIIGEVIVVRDPDMLEEILRAANDTVIIVNLHGESVPTPSWVWRGAGYLDKDSNVWVGRPPDWLDWFSLIRSAIEKGTIWVNVGGWPFYYVFNETCDRSRGFYEVGIEWFGFDWKSWKGYHGYDYIVYGATEPHERPLIACYLDVSGVEFHTTSVLRQIAPLVELLTGLKVPDSHIHNVSLDRPCHVAIYHSYYDANVDGTVWHGAYVLRLGRGWIVHVGFGITISEEERAAIILAALIDIVLSSK